MHPRFGELLSRPFGLCGSMVSQRPGRRYGLVGSVWIIIVVITIIITTIIVIYIFSNIMTIL